MTAGVDQPSHREDTGASSGRPGGHAADGCQRTQLEQARTVAANAHAPYSQLQVGAVLGGWSGRSYLGVNVENASYPVGLCAERAALAAAVAAGERRFTTLAVATAAGGDIVPCGACLQALAEFGDLEVVVQTGGEARVFSLNELLPLPFGPAGR